MSLPAHPPSAAFMCLGPATKPNSQEAAPFVISTGSLLLGSSFAIFYPSAGKVHFKNVAFLQVASFNTF